jgi:hypothetical protein
LLVMLKNILTMHGPMNVKLSSLAVRFEVLTAESQHIQVFWDATLCCWLCVSQ